MTRYIVEVRGQIKQLFDHIINDFIPLTSACVYYQLSIDKTYSRLKYGIIELTKIDVPNQVHFLYQRADGSRDIIGIKRHDNTDIDIFNMMQILMKHGINNSEIWFLDINHIIETFSEN